MNQVGNTICQVVCQAAAGDLAVCAVEVSAVLCLSRSVFGQR